MYRGVGVNGYGTPVSLHTCDVCGDKFSVCPEVPEDRADEWDGCMSVACDSYEPMRDAELYLGLGRVGPERKLIGYVCEKGNHLSFDGYVDHGACGSHYYADIYVTVERRAHEDGTPYYGRGQQPDLDEVATAIRDAFEVSERSERDD